MLQHLLQTTLILHYQCTIPIQYHPPRHYAAVASFLQQMMSCFEYLNSSIVPLLSGRDVPVTAFFFSRLDLQNNVPNAWRTGDCWALRWKCFVRRNRLMGWAHVNPLFRYQCLDCHGAWKWQARVTRNIMAFTSARGGMGMAFSLQSQEVSREEQEAVMRHHSMCNNFWKWMWWKR